jgi:hypothetical protein
MPTPAEAIARLVLEGYSGPFYVLQDGQFAARERVLRDAAAAVAPLLAAYAKEVLAACEPLNPT